MLNRQHDDDLINVLIKRTAGEVYHDPTRLGMYATDASHYQMLPRAVVVPIDESDVKATIEVASQFGVPITGRGAGTSLAGQTFGRGIVIDFSKHMNRVLEVDVDERWARVQPGVVRDHLNKHVSGHNLHFAPDPATTSRATIGGMINNNSSGMHSIIYGKTIDHVLSLRVLLADGEIVELGLADLPGPNEKDGRLAEIRCGIAGLLNQHEQLIRENYPKVMRRVSGYSLDYLLDPPDNDQPNLAHLICGSEGTLGLVLEATVRLSPVPQSTSLVIVHFDDLIESLRHLPAMLEHDPSAVELLDQSILREAIDNPSARDYAGFIQGQPEAVQIVEFFGGDSKQAADRAAAFALAMREQSIGYASVVRDDPSQIKAVWELRRLGVGLQSNVKGSRKPVDFIDDACVPVAALAEYIFNLQTICERHGVEMPVCAHASVGVLHPKPMLDLRLQSDQEKMRSIAWQAYEQVRHFGGAWCGEHGDGQVRGEFVQDFFGEALYQCFRDIKALFDPQGLMNPGKIIDTPGMTDNLRYGDEDYTLRIAEVESNFRYEQQGGFALAVEQCNGIGACRKIDVGTMCPSYMATGDEEATTRGRANALRLAMSGQLGKDALAGDGLHEAMSLCLACKGCKVECPNAVDMAKLKSDVLQMRYDRHGTPLSARLLGNIASTARLVAGPLAPLVNFIQRTKPYKRLASSLIGIDTRRPAPAFAKRSLAKLLTRRDRDQVHHQRPKVVLFNDTFINYFEPSVGLRAVEVLEACGYEVILANAGCCQRTRISKGLLHQAKRDGRRTIERLLAYAEQGLPIVMIEPSCASSLLDDLPDLLDDSSMCDTLRPHVRLIDQFLAEQLDDLRINVSTRDNIREVLIHTHCHQKALPRADATRYVLDRVDGLKVTEIDAGCCGMAGSFGYEQYDVSMAIGERRLFPAVRQAQARHAAICVNGTSCRQQVHDACDARGKHLIELIEVTAV